MGGTGKLWRLAPVAAVFAAAVLVSLPAWLAGVPAGSDTVFHASWYAHFSEQFRAGELYPRWLAGMNGGLGSPVFFYYAPLPYHLTSLLAPVVPAGDYGLRHLAYGTALSFVVSALTCYLWLRQISDRRGAAAGAVLFLLAPYHSVVDPLMRAAYSELWAFAWMPLVLYFARRFATDNSRLSSAGLSAGYALLALTHLPATLIFSPVPPAYAYFSSGRRVSTALRAFGSMALGTGLSAVYLTPALTMQPAASFADMQARNYSEHWLTFAKADAHDLYGQLLWGALTSAALVVCASLLAGRGRAPAAVDDVSTAATSSTAGRNPRRVELTFWTVTTALSIFMTTFASDPVWRLVPVLQKIQFPWRFQLVLCLAVAGATGVAVGSLRRGLAAVNRRALVFAALLVSCWLYFWAGAALRAYPDLPRPYRLGEGAVRSLDRSRDAPEYRPASAASNAEHDIETLLQNFCGDLRREPRACVAEGEGTATVTRADPRSLELRVESATGLTFHVTQFHFPGWTARLDGRSHPLTASRPDGLLLVSAPPGTHTLSLTLEPTLPERLGRIITIVSALLLMLLCVRPHLSKLRRTRRHATEKNESNCVRSGEKEG
ncbi:MAG TPA: 6-pyruvoyl-tetrahydropterin synthase-related protein [Pyrinomonadaceae bacterium]|nr:6-pyruvoyl-tetrahydropterin synthase-related protein [Pyrinomonadaceae bacterium]